MKLSNNDAMMNELTKNYIFDIKQILEQARQKAYAATEIMHTLCAQLLLSSQMKEPVIREMQKKTKNFQQDKLEFIGILLCTKTDKTIARYSVLNENKQLFASKYLSYLPTEEELAAEIERQKLIFQQSNYHE